MNIEILKNNILKELKKTPKLKGLLEECNDFLKTDYYDSVELFNIFIKPLIKENKNCNYLLLQLKDIY